MKNVLNDPNCASDTFGMREIFYDKRNDLTYNCRYKKGSEKSWKMHYHSKTNNAMRKYFCGQFLW